MAGLCISLLVVGSIAITNFDRLMNSECGFACGYVIEKYTLFNPLDFILVELSKFYPLDFILFGTILFYMFITCLYGLVRLGIKFLCINVICLFNLLKLYSIKKRATSPQALNLASLLIIFMMFSFSMQLLSIAP